MMQRELRALEYSGRVKERRRIRATWVLTAIEVCMLAVSVLLMVAVYAGR